MKKITLFLFMMFTSFVGYSQLFEDFEGTSLPNATTGVWTLATSSSQSLGSWQVINENINGIPSAQTWKVNTIPANVYAGTRSAYLDREGAAPGFLADDKLVTPAINVPANGQLRFWTRQTLAGNQGSSYSIEISTTSQTAGFTNLQTWTETEMNAVYNVYEEKIVSIPAAYWNLPTPSVYIRFVMTNNNGDRWLIDNVNVVEQCLDPTNLTASGATLTTSNLGWTNPSGSTQWEVEVVATGATPTGTGVAVSSNPYTAPGLTSGTCYDYYVKSLCTSGTSSEWVGPFNFCTVSLGATCDAPIPIGDVSGNPYTTTDNTSNYGDEYGGTPGSAATCGTGGQYFTGDDVFYSFTSSTGTSVTITSQTNTNFSGLFVYNNCTNVGVSCVAGSTAGNGSTTPDSVTFIPQVGVTYYIAIATWASPQPQSTPYVLTIIENTCTNMTATFAVVSNCASTANPNTFFVNATVTNMGTATSIVGTTNQTSPPQTITSPGVMQFGPFPNNTNVTVNLQNVQDVNCFRNSPTLTQTFCPATNDLCSGAIPVTCGSTVTQTTVGATTAGAPTTACGTTAGSGGLWYSFAGNGDIVTFSLCGSAYDTKIQIFTGSCGAFTCVTGNDDSCGLQSEVQVTTAVGTLYYVYVYGFGTAQGVFTLNTTCITPPPPPANDNCTTATTVPVNTDGTCTQLTPGTVVGATPSTQANACVGTADDDVWFSFTATQTTHTITLQDIAGSTLDLNHVVYSSTNATNPCGNLSQVICSNPNFSLVTGLVAGQVYYIRVYTAVATPLQTTTFNVCVSVPPPPPSNDSCATPIIAPVNSANTCTLTVPGTITSATASPEPNACGGTDDDDVWFQFTATNNSHIISLNNIIGTNNNLNFVVYSGASCGALTQVACNLTNSSTIAGLTVGTTYLIRVYTDTATTGQFANFDLCIGSPPISVDNTTYTVQQLISEVLIDSPCAQVTNITWKTGNTNNFGSTNGIAYFEENAPGVLPFPNGLLMTTGNAMRSSGPNDVTLSDGNTAWTGDTQLEAIVLAGTGNTMSSRNATVIEFDFVPLINQISFDFMFASEEYGTFQCSFSDSFAFILTDIATGTTTNLAIIPGTTTPISVVTIRDALYNTGCNSVNPQFFDVYNGAPNQATAATNYNGQTVQFTAASPVTPLAQYHIKMVIADRSDNAYDSAVFLKAGSFDIGNIDLGDDFLQANGTAICFGENYLIESGLDPSLYTFTWSDSTGILTGETGPDLNVNGQGEYTISAQYIGTTCQASDSIIIEYYDDLLIGSPNNLVVCNSTGYGTFDLTENTNVLLNGLNPSDYAVSYYLNQADADSGVGQITSDTSYDNITQFQQTIHVRVQNIIEGCYKIEEFDLIIQDLTPQFTLTSDFSICQNDSGTITVTPINFIDSDVTYTWTLGTNTLPDTTSSISVNQAGTYTVVVNNNGCIGSMSTIVTILPLPTGPAITSNSPICSGTDAVFTITGIPNSVVSYTINSGTLTTVTLDTTGVGLITSSGVTSDVLLALSNINDGSCNLALTDSSTVTVLALPISPTISTNGPICSGSNAQFTLTGTPNAVVTYAINAGASQTITLDGSGSGLITQNGVTTDVTLTLSGINDGTCSAVITNSSTVVVNIIPSITSLTSNNQICINNDVIFNIIGSPNAVVTYAISGGSSQTVTLNASGNATVTVTNATVSQTIVLSAISLNGCSNNSLSNSSMVTVISLPVADIRPSVSVCKGSTYNLTALSSGNSYYTGSNGTGTMLSPGDIVINGTQTIYILASTGTPPNVCTSEGSFVITAVDLPQLTLDGGCQGSSYVITATVVGAQAVTYQWSNSSGVIQGATSSTLTVNQDGDYGCVVTLSSGSNCSSEVETYYANGTLCTIQKGISPNGDGLNENFDLTGLNVKLLHVYNRYGKEVYSFANYTDQWYGQSNKGEELPEGTYYFVIERDNVDAKTGWIYINR